ncbi:MAG TPA: response regulator [Magnetospirillaceae bacterium]|nr:response regulator [Magnetospirillaceae bacterium]
MASDRKILDGRKVLVADDEPFNLSIIVRMMRDLGCYELTAVATGGEALQALDGVGKKFNLAVLDFNMPGANGLQILKQLRTGTLPVPRETHVMMLTGSSDFGLVGAAMALDVDAFIIKPVSQQAMAARLEKVFGQKTELKSPEDYSKIDIEAVSQRLLSRKPVGLVRAKAEAKKTANGLPVRLESVKPGAILSEDVRSPNGELLLGKATMLSERLIRRLIELQSMLKLDYVYVFPPSSES